MAAKKKKAGKKKDSQPRKPGKAPKVVETKKQKKSLADRVEQVIGELGGIDPLHLLTCYVNGFDPRPNRLSPIFLFFQETVKDRGTKPPTISQWEKFGVLVHDNKQASVTSEQSQAAAKELIQYQHPKLRSTEVSAKGAGFGSTTGTPSPLTKHEIALFESKFNEEY